MRLLEIDGISYTIGLEWFNALGPGVKKEISSYVKEEGLSYGIILSSDSDEEQERNALDQLQRIKKNQAYQVGATEDDEAKGTISLAALLSKMAYGNAVFLLTITNDEKWVLAINDGQVVPGTDSILKDDEALALVSDMYEALVGGHSEETPMVVISDDEAFIGFSSDHDSGYVECISSPGELIGSGLLNGDGDGFAKKSKINSLEKSSGIKLILLGAIVAGGYYGYKYYQGNQEAQRLLQEQARRAIEQKEPEGPSDEELLEEARVEEEEWFREKFSGYSNIDIIEESIRRYMTTPRRINGWRAEALSVDKNRLSVAWSAGRGTTLGFTKGVEGKFDNVSFDGKGEHAVITENLDFPSLNDPIGHEILDNARDRVWLNHLLKVSDINSKIGRPALSERPEKIKNLKNVSISSQRQIPYRTSEITFSGTGMNDIRATYRILDEENRVKVSEVQIDLINGNWEIKGAYYEK